MAGLVTGWAQWGKQCVFAFGEEVVAPVTLGEWGTETGVVELASVWCGLIICPYLKNGRRPVPSSSERKGCIPATVVLGMLRLEDDGFEVSHGSMDVIGGLCGQRRVAAVKVHRPHLVSSSCGA